MNEILDSISHVLSASMNDAVDTADDPQAMLAQLLHEYATVIESARQAHAQATAQLQLADDDVSSAQAEAAGWGVRAQAAAQRAAAIEAAGNPADAARFDDLARRALRQQVSDESLARRLRESVAAQAQFADQLKEGLNGMRAKLLELQAKRAELVARASLAEAQARVDEAQGQMAEAQRAVAASLADFEAMDVGNDMDNGRDDFLGSDTEAEVETRLAELKHADEVLATSAY
jgi:phage shock protein A